MKNNMKLARGLISGLLLGLAVSASFTAFAQQKQLSVEELEAYIAEQKGVLEEAQANRDKTQEKVEKVKAALAEQEARKALVEEELETLCKEQEALKSGTYDECRAHSDS